MKQSIDRLRPDRQAQRKTHQFCKQVQRALNLALTDLDSFDDLSGVFIEDVSPAPDCGRLLARVVVPNGLAVTDVLSALRRNAPRLRSEVAMAITRKRAPELFFAPAYIEGGADD